MISNMRNGKFVFISCVLVFVIVFGGVIYVSNSSTSKTRFSPNSSARTLDPTSFDWGDIPYDGPLATKTFTIRNEGTEPLKLLNVKTSCHCTKTYITIDGKNSPSFGMSGVSDWTGEVAPGEDALIVVVFDQRFHGQAGIGPITRFVSVETNDKGNEKITFTLTGIVIK